MYWLVTRDVVIGAVIGDFDMCLGIHFVAVTSDYNITLVTIGNQCVVITIKFNAFWGVVHTDVVSISCKAIDCIIFCCVLFGRIVVAVTYNFRGCSANATAFHDIAVATATGGQ